MRQAGLVGGVLGAFALSGAAAPAMADSASSSAPAPAAAPAAPVAGITAVPLSTAATALQAADAIEQDAIVASLAAAEQQAADEAAKAAAAARKAELAKAAAARAASERAAAARAAASRSAERARLATVTTSASSGSSGASASTTPAASAAPASSSKVDSLIAFLKSQVGKPYVYGATGPGAYDCSGLTQAAFASVGVTLPRTSQEQSSTGASVSIGSLQPGDLVFWGGRGSAFHVGVYIGDGQYLDAANSSTPVGVHQMSSYMPDGAARLL
ncbi:C40 family peptidase [Streptomyces sp.]|uniref:C40 family peptidase n=1 Tax=Streptomyces sp. TaxID=1931 RepID=UPI002F40C4F8